MIPARDWKTLLAMIETLYQKCKASASSTTEELNENSEIAKLGKKVQGLLRKAQKRERDSN